MSDKIQKVYKIRNSEGLFSPGGQNDFLQYDVNRNPIYKPLNFLPKGKTWNSIGHVKSHVKGLKIVGSDWEIVEYNLIEKETYKAVDYKSDKAITTDELIIKNIIE